MARFYINLIVSTSGAAESNEKILDSLKAVMDMYGDSLNPHAYSFVLSELERNVLLRGEVWISISIVAGKEQAVIFRIQLDSREIV